MNRCDEKRTGASQPLTVVKAAFAAKGPEWLSAQSEQQQAPLSSGTASAAEQSF